LAALRWRGHSADLLHHAQSIVVSPRLRYLASREAVYSYPRYLDTVLAWRNAHELPLVGASSGPASDHPITFCYLVLDRDLGVGEDAVVEVHDVPIPFGARREIGEGRVVVDAVLCGDLVCDVDVLRVEEFFKLTTG
jgi:hypothetical protein